MIMFIPTLHSHGASIGKKVTKACEVTLLTDEFYKNVSYYQTQNPNPGVQKPEFAPAEAKGLLPNVSSCLHFL